VTRVGRWDKYFLLCHSSQHGSTAHSALDTIGFGWSLPGSKFDHLSPSRVEISNGLCHQAYNRLAPGAFQGREIQNYNEI